MKILVTGARGLLGHELCRQLHHQGHEVIAVDDGSRGQAHPECARLISVDLAQGCDLDTDFDVIYHLAARNGTPYFYQDNNALIRNNVGADHAVFGLAHSCPKLQAFVYASSSEVVAGHAPPQSELADIHVADLHNPRWSYRLAKMLGENYVVNSGLPWVIIRYFNVYGANSMQGHFVHDVLAKIQKQQFELIGADEVRCYCHVEDAMSATIGLTDRQGHIVNLGSDEPLTARQAADIMALCLGHDAVTWNCLPGRAGSSACRIPDLAQIRRLLPDYRPRDFATGVKQVIDARCKRPSL